jgi:hypothetical protein
MGLDFIRKAAPAFHKALDRRTVELRTPTLFNRDIPSVARRASAEICRGSTLALGEKILLRVLNNKLVAQRDNVVVAEFAAPPPEFVKQIQAGAGIELGMVVAVHEISQIAEVGFCD